MKRDRLGRHLLISFVTALGLYAALFWFIEHRRTAQTPWLVSFESDTTGHITLEISQRSLNLGPVKIHFAATTTNSSLERTLVEFRKPRPVPRPMPTGQCMFEDLTFLPGTVALTVAGRQIQMLPRALTIGTNEFAWSSGCEIEVAPDGASHITKRAE